MKKEKLDKSGANKWICVQEYVEEELRLEFKNILETKYYKYKTENKGRRIGDYRQKKKKKKR